MSKYNWTYVNENEKPKEEKFKYLCEYYNVSPEEALKLGTRSSGRKPNLPASKTCDPVNNMTFEDIWALKERKTVEDIFDFYIDQGAWASFRQTVRHFELENLHKSVYSDLIKSDMHIVEYGCGVAPFVTTFLKEANENVKFDISLSDVDGSEHLYFAEWKLKKIIKDRNLENVNLYINPVKPKELPKYDKKIDFLINFEVMEHVPSPIEVINNLMEYMDEGSVYMENFIKHERSDDDDLGPDLQSAAYQRNKYYEILEKNFNLRGGRPPSMAPNETRFWVKK